MIRKLIFIFILLSVIFIMITDSNLYSFYNPYRENIRHDVIRSIKMAEPHIRKQWRKKQIDKLTTALIAVEDTYSDIDHKFLLATILTESEMDIYCVPKRRNKNKSIDYGLSQQNSFYIKKRYAKARKILKSMNLKYSKDRFDILVNVMAGAVTLHEFKTELRDTSYKDKIPKKYKTLAHYIAYNVGARGLINPKREEKRSVYYNRYTKYLMRLQHGTSRL